MPDPTSTNAEALPKFVATQIAAGFRLGRVASCQRVTQGLMNPNWRLTAESGSYAIKQIRDRPPATVRDNHRVLPALADRGLPVPLPCTTPDGDTLLHVGDDWYTATTWLPGAHLTGDDLGLDACAALGALTGRLHDGLAQALPGPPRQLPDTPASVEDTHARLDHFARAAARGPVDAFDNLALAEIRRRHTLLNQIAHQRPQETEAGPYGWTHGDLQPLNILINPENHQVTAILDWDRLDIRCYGLEIVRTATIWFTNIRTGALDLDRVTAFIAGYRTQRSITDAQLLDAAHRRWWHLATGTWQLRLHYDQQENGCDHIFLSDARLLRWWLTHNQAVNAALVV
jgi:Ser/Thr protein kinase RdoA (MazF antagonist)